MKVIITGATGMLGSLMIDYLLESTECEIVGTVRERSDRKNVNHLSNNDRVRFRETDLVDPFSVAYLIDKEKPDYFINFAAKTSVPNSSVMPLSTFEINASSVINCLEGIKKYQPNCRFYNAGSSEQFGDAIYAPQNEEHPIRTRNMYGASKAAAALIVNSYSSQFGLFAVNGIMYNNEHWRRGDNFFSTKVCKGAAQIKLDLQLGRKLTPIKLGSLDSLRDWSYSPDFCDGIWKMLNQSCPHSYILSSGKTRTTGEFVEEAFQSLGINNYYWDFMNGRCLIDSETNQILVKTDPEFFREPERVRLEGDNFQAKLRIKWIPKTSFKEMISKITNHHYNKLYAQQ